MSQQIPANQPQMPQMMGGGQQSNNMLEFLMFQVIGGYLSGNSSQTGGFSGVISLLLIQNIGEIKKVIQELYEWIKSDFYLFALMWLTYLRDRIVTLWKEKVDPVEVEKPGFSGGLVSRDEQSDSKLFLDMNLKIAEMDAKSQTDLLALVNYFFRNKIYLNYLSDVERISSDKYSTVEKHYLDYPIDHSIDDNLNVVLNTPIETQVEISLHDPESLRVQRAQLADMGENISSLDEIIVMDANTLLNHELFDILARKFKDDRGTPNRFFIKLKEIGLNEGIIDHTNSLINSDSGFTLFSLYSSVYNKLFPKVHFYWLVIWMIAKGGASYLNDLLLLPYDESKKITVMGVSIKVNPEGLFPKNSMEYRKISGFLKEVNDEHLLGTVYDQLFKNFIEPNMGNQIYDNNLEEFSEKFKNWVKVDASYKKGLRDHTLSFYSQTLNRNDLYLATQEFMNNIRVEYYKHIKMPQAFKEVKVFTIKINYIEETTTEDNPEWEESDDDENDENHENGESEETEDKSKNKTKTKKSEKKNSEKLDEKEDDKKQRKQQWKRHQKQRNKFGQNIPRQITKTKITPKLVTKQVGQTYKPLEYLYMEDKDKKHLQAILGNFTTNSELYQRLGIMHKLTCMLYGNPGCGKSTAIRSIASYLQRDIYYLDLKGIRSNAHLQMIFDYLQTNCGGGGVVVMEDIDCMTDIVLSRTMSEKDKYEHTMNQSIIGQEKDITNEETLTLSYLLNLLDGTISIEDLVVIMTTNHPEKLDPALTRPGRVDAKLQFKKCDRLMMVTIFESLFQRKLSQEISARIIEDKFTPAEVIFTFLPKLYQLDETDESIMHDFCTK